MALSRKQIKALIFCTKTSHLNKNCCPKTGKEGDAHSFSKRRRGYFCNFPCTNTCIENFQNVLLLVDAQERLCRWVNTCLLHDTILPSSSIFGLFSFLFCWDLLVLCFRFRSSIPRDGFAPTPSWSFFDNSKPTHSAKLWRTTWNPSLNNSQDFILKIKACLFIPNANLKKKFNFSFKSNQHCKSFVRAKFGVLKVEVISRLTKFHFLGRTVFMGNCCSQDFFSNHT